MKFVTDVHGAGSAVVSTVVSQKKKVPSSNLCVEFVCSPHVSVGSLQVQTNRLISDSKLASVNGCSSLCALR